MGDNLESKGAKGPIVVLDIRLQEGWGRTPSFYFGEDASGDSIKVNPAEYRLVPNRRVKGKEVYVRK